MKVLVYISFIIFFLTFKNYLCISKGSTVSSKLLENETMPQKLNNPAVFLGSSFGIYFQSLYRLNQYEKMMAFTSIDSRKKYSDISIKKFYSESFYFDFTLGKLTSIIKEGNTLELIYANAKIEGTSNRKIIIPILIENDSCKVILKSLMNPFKYLR